MMQDRYLYRAKRIFDGKWVEGFLTKINRQLHIVNQSGENAANQIDESTVCQCTGLMDKNGKLIYENDIVELYDRNIDFTWRAVLIFGNPCEYTWGWHLEPIGECNANEDILCWIDMEESGAFCEIIGNTFDNPELLEVKKDNV